MAGKLRGKKLRRRFEAMRKDDDPPPDDRAVCGNGIVEPGETCDGTECPGGQRCTADCACPPEEDPGLCVEASTCEAKRFCGSGREECRCIRSAEGDIRCGAIPSCAVPKCSTSEDCTLFGPGYFCDTPNSGCCSDGHLTRCIAPCQPISDPDNVFSELSGATQRFLLAAHRATRGLEADLDGDGIADIEATLTGDVLHLRRDADGDGRPEYRSESDPEGNVRETLDGDSDGRPEETIIVEAGAPPRRILTRDTDLDGTLDRRETLTYDVAAKTVRVVVGTDPEGDGTFATVADVVAPIAREAGREKCDGGDGFPLAPSTRSRFRAGTYGNISVVCSEDGSGGTCTRERAKRVVKALDCALDTGRRCLEKVNRSLHYRLFRTVARETLFFACGNTCAGKDATTSTWVPVPGLRDGKTNLNPSHLDAMSDDELCALVLHEMLHWVGEGTGDPTAHEQGHDRTYSCGRYCGRCTSRGPSPAAHGLPTGPNADCARCAGTEAEKRRCGTKRQEIDIPCPAYNLCHAGLAGSVACQTCRGLQELFCDDSLPASVEPTFRCCQTCPSGFRNTDKPCFGDGSNMLSCAQKPPDCP